MQESGSSHKVTLHIEGLNQVWWSAATLGQQRLPIGLARGQQVVRRATASIDSNETSSSNDTGRQSNQQAVH